MNSHHPTIGGLLRSLRARKGWTLKQMSQHSGIPLSTLSKVEHDRLTLTYDKLLQLSQRLQLRMSELFAEQDDAPEPAVTARRSIGRIEDAIRVNTPNYDYYYLCPELRRKRMIPVLTKVRAKSIEEFGELVHHSGEEYIHVLEGRVEVHTEFYDPIVLDAGQSVYIDSNMGHAYLAAKGCKEALLLGVCSSSDEQLLESLMTLHGDETAAQKTRQKPVAVATKAAAAKPKVARRSPAAARKKT
ncbi:helix-turn-helix domain-containing protein [Xanthomonas sp. NCPPB 2654]|uniref:helix-turn-helix domain-containing protein n=1 Tax=unclassified Xanthomonas TaxID=2643310 RepID=UPI0021DF46FE|nr:MULTISPECIES: helix-turn-helix domain-containing protein [unclassified Xanthomonas]MDL5366628.1 helix-turn-helix domain-containing protein [Xanthomonas sp. NCPPB 2654]UYC21190.1 helix-turn-helix domain-containing protein [Xanthomonas sp. CFBP 8443]